jgi:hypothetical protein
VVPEPELRDMKPPVPVLPVTIPASIDTPPPDLVAVPAWRLRVPLFPPLALPVDIAKVPDEPLLVVPVLKVIEPLIPLVPESGVFTTTDPLDLAVPAPVVMEIEPPVVAELRPDIIVICPPMPPEDCPELN